MVPQSPSQPFPPWRCPASLAKKFSLADSRWDEELEAQKSIRSTFEAQHITRWRAKIRHVFPRQLWARSFRDLSFCSALRRGPDRGRETCYFGHHHASLINPYACFAVYKQRLAIPRRNAEQECKMKRINSDVITDLKDFKPGACGRLSLIRSEPRTLFPAS